MLDDLFKGKTIIELYRTVERLPFYEEKKKLFDDRKRRWLIYPEDNKAELRPCNTPIHIVLAAHFLITTKEERKILKRLVFSSISNLTVRKKGGLFDSGYSERVSTQYPLITDELVDSIIYCVLKCHYCNWQEGLLGIDHNLSWLFWGSTSKGDRYIDATKLYQELPRKTI